MENFDVYFVYSTPITGGIKYIFVCYEVYRN
jgi:hypothetical protein